MKRLLFFSAFLMILVLVLVGCGKKDEDKAGLANPASTKCINNGYQLEMRTTKDGGQYGICKFPDGSECEEWAYFREECKMGDMDRVSEPEVLGEETEIETKPGIESRAASAVNEDEEDKQKAKRAEGEPETMTNQVNSDKLSIIILAGDSSNETVNLFWQVSGGSYQGYQVLVSTSPDPVYPGSTYHYISSPSVTEDVWYGLEKDTTYHFRVCGYVGGQCGIYSNDLEVVI